MKYRTSYGFRHFARHLFLNGRTIALRVPQPKPKASRLEKRLEDGSDYPLLTAQPRHKVDLSSLRKKLARIEKQLARMPSHQGSERLLRRVKLIREALRGL